MSLLAIYGTAVILSAVLAFTSIYLDGEGDWSDISFDLIIFILFCSFIPLINVGIAGLSIYFIIGSRIESRQLRIFEFNHFVQCKHKDCGLHFREGHILLFSENLTARTCPSCERPIHEEDSDLHIKTDIDFSPFIPYSSCKKLHKHFKGKKNVYFANQQSKMYNEQQLARITKLRDDMERERRERNGELGLPKEIEDILK